MVPIPGDRKMIRVKQAADTDRNVGNAQMTSAPARQPMSEPSGGDHARLAREKSR